MCFYLLSVRKCKSLFDSMLEWVWLKFFYHPMVWEILAVIVQLAGAVEYTDCTSAEG